MRFEFLEQLPSVHQRHIDIQEYPVRTANLPVFEFFQCLLPPALLVVTNVGMHLSEYFGKQQGIVRVVVNQKQAFIHR